MGKIVIGVCIVASIFFADAVAGRYEPPKATVEPLSPRGIRISIPHEDGITLVAFHVKFNEDFDGLEAGTIAKDITKVRNGRWTYKDQTTRLHTGDIVYYWVHVVYDGLGYNLLDQQHQVTEFFQIDGTKVNSGSGHNNPGTVPGGCAPTDTKLYDMETGGRKDVCAGQLLLEDQFNILNETLWRQIEKFTGAPHHQYQHQYHHQRLDKIDERLDQFAAKLAAIARYQMHDNRKSFLEKKIEKLVKKNEELEARFDELEHLCAKNLYN